MSVPIPIILRDEFEAFREILGDSLPNEFGLWLDQVETWRVHYARQGEETVSITVSAAELREYLAETGRQPGLSVLLGLAERVREATPGRTEDGSTL